MFEENDYLKIINDYYHPSIKEKGSSVDISGWEYAPLGLDIPGRLRLPESKALRRYYADSGDRLDEIKERMIPALEVLAQQRVPKDTFTLLPSATAAMNVVLVYLKDRGVKHLFIEAPAYYVVMDAARRLGMSCHLVAPEERENGIFVTDMKVGLNLISLANTCLWLHQPRYAIGSDLSAIDVDQLVGAAASGRYLVIDEANDDSVPSLMAGTLCGTNVFRVRSLTKPFGLNGVRLAMLMHPSEARDAVTDIMWSVGAALDWFSLSCVLSLMSPPRLYADQLLLVRQRLNMNRRSLDASINGSPIQLLPGSTGSLACLRLDWRSLRGTEQTKREQFIVHLARHGVPGMLGGHLYMPKCSGFEHIRVNLFNELETIQRGISVIQSFLVPLSDSED